MKKLVIGIMLLSTINIYASEQSNSTSNNATLSLIGLKVPEQQTTNYPSEKQDTKSETSKNTNNDDESYLTKLKKRAKNVGMVIKNKGNKLWKGFQNGENNVSKWGNKYSNKFNLPIHASVKNTNVANFSLNYSLVNDKCQINVKKIWKKQINNLIKKYKQMWKQLTNGAIWKMWAINQAIEGTCWGIGYLTCVVYQKFFDYIPKQHFMNEYQDCVTNMLKGTLKMKNGSEAGTNIVAAGMTPGSGVAPMSNPSVEYIPCGATGLPPCGMPFTLPKATKKTSVKIDPAGGIGATACYWEVLGHYYSKAIKNCIENRKKKCLSLFNGKIDLGINMGLLNFRIQQQACILKKYSVNVNLTKIITDSFKMDEKGKITLKNFKDNDPKIAEDIMTKVFKSFSPDEYGKYLLNKYQKIDNLLGLNRTEKAYSFLTYYNFLGWLNLVFNTPQSFNVFDKGSYKIKYSTGRWALDNVDILTKKFLHITKSYPVSVYKECLNIANYSVPIKSKMDTNSFFLIMSSDQYNSAKTPHNILGEISKPNKVKTYFGITLLPKTTFAPGYTPKSLRGEILTPRNIFISTLPSSYASVLNTIKDPKDNLLFKDLLTNGIPYFDLNEINLMNQACYKWTNLYLNKLLKIQESQYHTTTNLIVKLKGTKKYIKQSGIVENYYKSHFYALKNKIKALKKLNGNLGENIYNLNFLISKVLIKIKNKNSNQNNVLPGVTVKQN